MSLLIGGSGNNVTIENSSTNPANVAQVITTTSALGPMGLGLEARTRANNYPEIIRAKSIYAQTDNITTTERSIGMPTGSGQDIFSRLATAGQIQISSTSANDTSAGTGARTVLIQGLRKDGTNKWLETSETLTLNGQTAVTSVITDWWRVNKMFVITAGSTAQNVGDIYTSPDGQALTAGVPDANINGAMIAIFSNSTMGCFSIATDQGFQYTKGNFFVDIAKNINIHEFFFQDPATNGGTNQIRYEVGVYPISSISYDYGGAAPYTEETDIALTCFTDAGSAVTLTYYVEYALTDAKFTNP